MPAWEDHYEILQVHPSAEPEIIDAAYRKLAFKYHPDRNKDPASGERMKRINLAYEVLKDPEQRKQYDLEWRRKKGTTPSWTRSSSLPKPRPVVQPQCIRFDDVEPGEAQTASFVIRNIGGPYTKIWISDPDSWVRVVRSASLTDSDELPLRVEIEAQGEGWEKSYSEYIIVKLDEEETQVRVDLAPLATKPVPRGELKWKFKTEGKVYSSPAVSDGVVYVGSDDRNLYAVDAKTGQQKWKFKTEGKVYSSPVVSGGLVYFGSGDRNLYAVDAQTGQQKWKFKTGGDVRSSPAVSDGVVYAGNDDRNLYAVDAKTGQQKWKFKTGGKVYSSPAVSGGVVYFGSYDGNLYTVDAQTGQRKWKFKTGGYVRSSPAVADGVVYVGSYDANLYAVDAKTGQQKWKFKTGWWVAGWVGQWMWITGGWVESSPAVSDGVVYFGSTNGNLYAVDAKTGQQKWKFKTGWLGTEASPAVSDGVVYLGTFGGNLYAVDARTGQQKWKFKTGWLGTGSSPAVSDGVVYLGSCDGLSDGIKALR